MVTKLSQSVRMYGVVGLRKGDRRGRDCRCVIRKTGVWASTLRAEGTGLGVRVVIDVVLRRVHGWVAKVFGNVERSGGVVL